MYKFFKLVIKKLIHKHFLLINNNIMLDTYADNKENSSFNILVSVAMKYAREFPHTCVDCSKIFGYKSHLNSHIISVHSGKSVYNCKKCDKHFEGNSKLLRHINYAHNNNNNNKESHKCTKCNKLYTRYGDLVRHCTRSIICKSSLKYNK